MDNRKNQSCLSEGQSHPCKTTGAPNKSIYEAVALQKVSASTKIGVEGRSCGRGNIGRCFVVHFTWF
jgi:hypothetical protein